MQPKVFEWVVFCDLQDLGRIQLLLNVFIYVVMGIMVLTIWAAMLWCARVLGPLQCEGCAIPENPDFFC